MAARDERVMVSEEVAPVMLARVLNSFDLVVIFVGIVLFIVNSATIQSAGPASFIYWILAYVTFLIPGAIITSQLGRMFPEEGSLYVWTHKALGPFWGFFAGFMAWWPGIMVMVITGALVVTLSQSINPSVFPKTWQQGLVVLAVIWFGTLLSILRVRVTQNYVNVQFVFYAAAIFVMGLAGLIWLANGNASANSFAASEWNPFIFSNWTFFGLAVLALLGIEVPLNMGVEIKSERAINRYLFWGSIVVMVAYLWTTFSNMVVIPLAQNNATTGGVATVQVAINHTLGSLIALILIWFFVSNTAVYNYSFARLLFVSGLERRLPHQVGQVSRNKVPANAVIVQAVLSSILAAILFFLLPATGANANKPYLALLAGITVVWCVSMVLLFADVFFVRRLHTEKFESVRSLPAGLLYASGAVGLAASVVGAVSVFNSPFDPTLFSNTEWRVWVGAITLGSAVAAALIYLISELVKGEEVAPGPTAAPLAGGEEGVGSGYPPP